MSFFSYLVSPFEHNHETTYFNKIHEILLKEYDDSLEDHYLIGNVSCNGHPLDALFLSRGKITVIDFKKYSGVLGFSENQPWKIKTQDGKTAFVRGGGRLNPLHQVKAYKYGLLNILRPHEDEILEQQRDTINLGHISTLVLFDGHVTFNQGEIPDSNT